MNTFKTIILLTGLTLLLLLIGYGLGQESGMLYALIAAAVLNFFAYWFSDKIVLLMSGARPLKESDSPGIYALVQKLTGAAGLPMPKLFVIDMPMPNAFATGRNPRQAAVVLTTGIIALLTEDELAGVIAHELSHIRNRDTLIATIAATLAGAIFYLSRMIQWAAIFGGYRDRDRQGSGNLLGSLLLALLAPLIALLIQLAISRSREYQADYTGAKISNNPQALANALRKLAAGVQHYLFSGNPTTASLFIVNPLRGGTLWTIFSTHPPIPERIRRLEKLAQEMSGIKVPRVIY